MAITIRKMSCPYDCPSTCGLLAEIENGRIVKVKNDKTHPVSKNGICRKMQHYEQDIYSMDRLMKPMRRVGKKGEGKFEPISWNEAVREITDHFKDIIEKWGSEAILPCVYSGVMSDIQRSCGDAFFNRMGALELVKTLCSSAKGAGYDAVVGKTGCLEPTELNDSDLYLIWSCNMAATRLQTLADLQKPANRHKKKILIDVYPNPTAAYCDQVITIKAGTDGALALAMMNVLKNEHLVDKSFVGKYTSGYPEFAETLDAYTPEWAESETGIPAEVIRQLAREFGEAKAPAIILGSGNSRHGNGGMTVRLITILSALTGAWQHPGGGLCGCTPIDTDYVNKSLITRPNFREKAARKININQIGQALAMEGKEAVRGFYVYGCNPANTVSDQQLILKGLEREDLFTVVHERFMTDTARYADILLPATFSVEQTDIYRAYGYCTLGTGRKLVDAPGECKSNWDTFCLLAKGMGYSEDYFDRSEDEMLDILLSHPTKAIAETSDEAKETLRQGGSVVLPFSDHLAFGTETGKMMIVNEKLAEPMPHYTADYSAKCQDWPLHLVAAPSVWSLNSTFLDREQLMTSRKGMTLWLNPEDAKVRKIEDGMSVIAFNELGEVQFTACIDQRVAVGNAVSEGVFASHQTQNGCGFNTLTHGRLSDIGAATTMNDNRIDIRPLSIEDSR
ncbi:MAG: molybdopterin-dependent oxidoreductase [Coprococcus sp.]|uniref:molybdopterin-containing oxidoreductase family protein n=1 Tax=Coprococcus catus TaxID=116085 RepID=UPI001C029441|nr:molybdopterin-dependent oxidoreductase [Coprococcus catus]MBT9772538.1 molybdopterin-dependent oxidoreductase [Coprococcus catus]